MAPHEFTSSTINKYVINGLPSRTGGANSRVDVSPVRQRIASFDPPKDD